MPLKNLFKRKSPKEEEVVVNLSAEEMPEPKDVEGYMRRGWAFHSKGKQEQAESDFLQALALDAESIDALFALGLTKKAQDQREASLEYFRKAMNLIETGKVEDENRTEMLRRLTLGHINELSEGDWNLENEIWHK